MKNKNINLRTIINSNLKFDEETHTYTYNGKTLISCTQLLAKHHLTPSYEGVDPELLKKSAEYGNRIHKEIEDYIKNGEIGESIELANFISWLETSGYEIIDSEYLVNNDIVAGKVDLLLKHKETNVYVIADIKTTSVVHKESVSWQLSVYNNLDEDIASLGLCLHFEKTGELELVSIPLKTTNDIERLFECERNGELFTYELENVDGALSELSKLETLIVSYKALIKQAEEEEKSLLDQVREEMESRNIKTMETNSMKSTIMEDSVRKTFDKKLLAKAHPELDLTEYEKETIVKGGMRITLKENKDNENATN